jgi:hypothetical protein
VALESLAAPMGKRFTETGKWSDSWFRKLSPAHKLGWQYLTDTCDAAGVIELDRELAEFMIGCEVDWDALIASSEGRIERLSNSRLWLTKFVGFQYGTLSDSCPPHKAAIQCLRKHGLGKVLDTYQIPNGNAQDKEKNKNKEKDKEKDRKGDARGKPIRPTRDDVVAYCAERGNGVDPEQWFDHYESNGWRVGRNPMKDWKAAVRKWEKTEFAGRASPTSEQTVGDKWLERKKREAEKNGNP